MPVAKVHRISAAAPNDVSGIAAAIAAGRIDPAGIVAVLGKTEGNGNVNDFTRGFATLALTLMLEKHIGERARNICLVMSGGTEGAMAPHWIVFERAEGAGIGPALAIGRAHTAALEPEPGPVPDRGLEHDDSALIPRRVHLSRSLARLSDLPASREPGGAPDRRTRPGRASDLCAGA